MIGQYTFDFGLGIVKDEPLKVSDELLKLLVDDAVGMLVAAFRG